jgi:hypothetical protein
LKETVGDPARLFSSDRHAAIWKVQDPLEFPLAAHGLPRTEAAMERITRRLSETLGSHAEDAVVS